MSHQNDTITKVDVRTDIAPPKLYDIKYNNDDKTPFEFVIQTLTDIIMLPFERATELTMAVHEKGSAIVKTDLTYEMANHLVSMVRSSAKTNNFPLAVELLQAK